MSEHVGPTAFTLPRHQKSCVLCKYHDQQMVRSGLNPVYRHYCTHPNAKPINEHPIMLTYTPERYIGQSSDTPQWCPVLNTATNEAAE